MTAKEPIMQRSISLPLSLVNWIHEESQRTGREFNATMVTLIRVGISEKMSEYSRENDLEKERSKEIIVKECSYEISSEEQAEMDKLLSAEPLEDTEKNVVKFKGSVKQ